MIDRTMRAISIRQPYAEQIMAGTKKIEYRSRATNIRGRVYVYASKTHSNEKEYSTEYPMTLPTGVLVGSIEIVDCSENRFGDWEYRLANPERLDQLIAPIQHPQPVWFFPFETPEKSDIVKQPRKIKIKKKYSSFWRE